MPRLPPSPSRAAPDPTPALEEESATAAPTRYRIHSGILTTASHLLGLSPSPSPTRSPLLPTLRTTLAAHPRYALVLTGHSLGAALASAVALLVSAWDPHARAWVVRPDAGLGPDDCGGEEEEEEGGRARAGERAADGGWRRPVRAVCFAHPTTLNAPLAARCAYPFSSPSSSSSPATDTGKDRHGASATPLVTSVSLGADVVCRMGIVPHVRDVRRVVGRLERARRRRGRGRDGGGGEEGEEEGGRVGVGRLWWGWRRAVRRCEEEGGQGDGSGEEVRRLEELAWRARAEAEGWDPRGAAAPEEDDVDSVEAAVPAGRAYHLDRLPTELEQRRRAELEREGGDELDGEDDLWGLYEVRDPRRFFQLPLLRSDLVGAHMPVEYLNACDSL